MLFFKSYLFLIQVAGASDSLPNNLLHVKVYSEVPSYNIEFKSKVDSKKVKFSPNIAAKWGVGLSLKEFLSIGYGFRLPQSDIDITQKGVTKYDDWRFNFAFSNFLLSANYQKFKGFYIENSSEIDAAWTSSSPYLQDSELSLTSASLNLTYIFNNQDFSLTSLLDQTSRQRQSGGSWLLGLALTQTSFSSPNPIIPSLVRTQFGTDQNIESGSFLAICLKLGYGYTLVFGEKWYAGLWAQLGGGPERREYRDNQLERHSWHSANKIDALASLGYNGDRWFIGSSLMGDATIYQIDSIDISSGLWSVKIFTGAHF